MTLVSAAARRPNVVWNVATSMRRVSQIYDTPSGLISTVLVTIAMIIHIEHLQRILIRTCFQLLAQEFAAEMTQKALRKVLTPSVSMELVARPDERHNTPCSV